MAQVWLSRRDCAEGTLPPLCLKCGRPATECVAKELAGTLLWAAPLAWLRARWGGQSAKLRVPMCRKHREYWQRRWWGLCVAVVGLPLYSAVLACLWLVEKQEDEVLLVLCVTPPTLALVVVWIVALSGIRAKEIDDDGVLLLGVSLRFAQTYLRERFLGGVDVDEALDKYLRRARRRRSEDVTDEA
jgi:hypothetical protein